MTTKRMLSPNREDGFLLLPRTTFVIQIWRGIASAGDSTFWMADGRRIVWESQEVATLMKATNQGKTTIHTMVFEVVPIVIHLAIGNRSRHRLSAEEYRTIRAV